jgi:outer membrane lipoprotein-sorting protein
MLRHIKKYWISLFLTAVVSAFACGGDNQTAAPQTGRNLPLNGILEKMQTAASQLKTLSADMEYLYIQDPELLDARTLRKGNLYYKAGEEESKLLISFLTSRQDDGEVQKSPEYFIFDGVWLTQIDMKLETINRYQKAPEDKPVGVFEFISHNFPMVGFTEPNKLEKEFFISVPENQPADSTHLHLTVREDSVYKEDYRELDVWVDNRTWLPNRLTAWSTQGDFFDLKWIRVQINKKLENDVFTIETPDYFSKNTHPLKETKERE